MSNMETAHMESPVISSMIPSALLVRQSQTLSKGWQRPSVLHSAHWDSLASVSMALECTPAFSDSSRTRVLSIEQLSAYGKIVHRLLKVNWSLAELIPRNTQVA